VLVYFARDLSAIALASLRAVFSARHRGAIGARLGLFIVVGSLPIAILGVAAKPLIEGQLRSLWVVAVALALFACLLWLAERLARHTGTLDTLILRHALVIGGAQALALIPGASRSGTTLMAALFCGLRRDDAARYSFLLSVPAVLGAGLFELRDALAGSLPAPASSSLAVDASATITGGAASGDHSLLCLLVATLAAFLVGYASIAWLLRFLRTRSTRVFVVYRLALAALLVVLLLTGSVAANPR
jgi:undecaprenyl-diphosphatase